MIPISSFLMGRIDMSQHFFSPYAEKIYSIRHEIGTGKGRVFSAIYVSQHCLADLYVAQKRRSTDV